MQNDLFILAEEIGQLLLSRGEMIATAESCTGGWIAQAITEIPGSSGWFDRGFVTYSNAAKVQMLGVRPQTLDHYGAVSAETAREMVAGALRNSDASWAVAVTGIAGPGGGSADKPVGTVFIAWQGLKVDGDVNCEQFEGTRHTIRAHVVKRALEQMIEFISLTVR